MEAMDFIIGIRLDFEKQSVRISYKLTAMGLIVYNSHSMF